MTKLWRKISVWFLSGLRRVFVPTLVGAICLALPLHADAWAEFEQRCLGPMEEIEAPVTVDLQKRDMAEKEGKSVTTYGVDLDDPGVLFFVITEDSHDGLVCGMTNMQIGATPRMKIEALIASGRYVSSGVVGDHTYRFQSDGWREPVLELELRSNGETVTWMARDTELEG